MKINSLKILATVLVLSLMVACSSKEESIVYDDTNKKMIDNNTNMESNNNTNSVDKLSNINTVDSNIMDNDMNSQMNNSYMNQVTSTIDGKNITLTSIHFDFDNYQIKNEMATISLENSNKINEVINNNSNVKVKVEGNCDEWGTDEYNFALGLKRAKAVKTSLINNGVKSSNIIIVSLGEGNPICNDKTADCWKQNRRVDHNLLP